MPTIGQILLDDALPPAMRGRYPVLDKSAIKDLFQEVAENHPEEYRDVAKRISDIGREVATETGGYSFGLDDLKPGAAVRLARYEMEGKLKEIYASGLPAKERNKAILEMVDKYKDLSEQVYTEAKDARNPLAMQVLSGARGKQVNLNSLVGADLLYEDHRGRPVPVPILHNYSQGLRPTEYFAGAFGARKGVLDLKQSTAKAGFLAKQLRQMNHRLVISDKDDDQPYDEQQPRGLPAEVDDTDSDGSYLSHPTGGYKRNTEITPKIRRDLRDKGITRMLVRSTMVGGPADGGVYAYDAGRRERGRLSPKGDFVGIAAADALAEPVTQASISSKHSGGIAGASAGAIGGFAAIDNLIQSPEQVAGGASHAQLDGRVRAIEAAPQGGHYMTIGDEQHYIAQGLDPAVKIGDDVEAGDAISSGTWDPGQIVQHKGLGEGRRQFIKLFRDTLKASDVPHHRRNIELLARGLLNYVRLNDEVGDYAPGDVVPYQSLERDWMPRAGSAAIRPEHAGGRYLERPVLHYSIGTKIRPSVQKELQQFNVPNVVVHQDPPPFEAEFVRGMAHIAQDPDWQVKMLGSFQRQSVPEAARRGATSDASGTSYVPAMVAGQEFGLSGKTKGWNPNDLATDDAADADDDMWD